MQKKITAQTVRHGELILRKIDALPKGAVLKEEVKEKILAWSETHHHHILKTETKKPFGIYTYEGKTYLGIIENAMLVHAKTGQDVHAPHKIAPAFYEVVIKKSYNYFSKIMERVKD